MRREGPRPNSVPPLQDNRAFLRCLLWCVVALAGCRARTVELPPPAELEPMATATARPTYTVAPMPEAEVATEAEQLVSRYTDRPPTIDGQVEALWEAAEPLIVPLTWGTEGTEHALDVELRALHDEQTLYLLARWPGEPPAGQEDTVYNQFTVHWRIPAPDAEHLDCDVACHTVFADGQGQVAYANAETIPHGGSETLQVAGGYGTAGDGVGNWTLEWSRPLVNSNPFDLQLDDRERAYDFIVKVFARIEGRPDPISNAHPLVFGP